MPASNPLVTIIIPTPEDALALERSVASVDAQTVLQGDTPVDVLLLVAAHENLPLPTPSSSRVTLRPLPPTSSQSAAVHNQLLAQAQGDVVVWLQPGDRLHPDRLAEGMHLLAEDPKLTAVFSFATFLDADGAADVALEEAFNQDLDPEEFAHRLLLGNAVVTSGTMVRRQQLVDLGPGPLDESLLVAHFYDLWCRLALRGPTRTVPLPLVTCFPAGPAHVSARRVAQESWLVATRHAGAIMRRWPTMPQTNFAFFSHVVELATISGDYQVVIDYLNLKRRAFGHDDHDCMRLVDCLVKLGRRDQAVGLLSTMQAERRRLAPATVEAVGARLLELQ